MAVKRMLTRRDLLTLGGLTAGGLVLGWPNRRAGRAAPAVATKRFVQINLEGGWDSALATDPIIGSKTGSHSYEPILRVPSSDLAPIGVAGKPQLVVGPGLGAAAPAFAAMPTAFVNGMYMEVSAHDFASQYISSGRLSLSQSRDYPSIPAHLGSTLGGYPPHVVLGTTSPPLGETRLSSPPLQAVTNETLVSMLAGPSGEGVKPDVVADAHALIGQLDALTYDRLPRGHRSDLALWVESSKRTDALYTSKVANQLAYTDAMKIRYGIDQHQSEPSGPEAALGSLYCLLASNLCPYLSATFSSFDTHSDHMAVHLPLMRRFATALAVFVEDLTTTNDPSSPELKLSDTTTLLITSEFVRTPRFNQFGGTDHWQSASAIVMGLGVMDGAVIGATDDGGNALGWDGARPVASNGSNQLLPDHLIATILAGVGAAEQANTVSTVRINGLFH